jgi:hypothetical protein
MLKKDRRYWLHFTLVYLAWFCVGGDKSGASPRTGTPAANKSPDDTTYD